MKVKEFFLSVGHALVRHFRLVAVIFAALMLAVAGCVAWYTVQSVKVSAAIADQEYMVGYNRDRVRLQIYEYKQAEAAIPVLQEEIEEIRQKAEEISAAKLAQRAAAPAMFRGSFRGISAAKKDAKARLQDAETAESLAREELNVIIQSLTGGEQP